jgi:O-antigen ligase
VITVALLLTFARGFWVGAFAGTLVVMLLSPATIRWRMLKLSAVMLVVAGFASYVFSGGIVGRLLESVGDRMLSSGKSLGDISLRARFIESQALIDRILPSPLIGNGLGARYSFYNVLQHTTSTTTYAHNGYLYLLFKLGLAGTGLLVVWFLKLLTVAWAGSRSTTGRPFMTAMIRASAGVLCGLLIITITSNVFIERESLLIVAIIGALVVSNTVSYPDRGTPA